ncbi:MAG: response regulator [Roseburia sp.]|nr:response regulator [Roseburia sp.]
MYRVLVADDEPIERTVVNKTIQKYFKGQLEVVEAVNGREAVQLFFEKKCQIALLDIEMPGINGLEAAERIRQNDKECSIVFLTAFDEFAYAKRAISVHALDYLLKPGADEELVAVLEEAIQIAKENEQRGENGVYRNTEPDRSIVPEENEDLEQPAENVRMTAVAEGIREYIDTHYMEDISLQTAAGAMNYSEAYFCKIFKQCFDKSFIVYLSEYRVEKAKQLLADVVINVKDISASVGYRDSNYFAKVFKRVAGTTPTEYRMQVLRAAGNKDSQGKQDE